MNPVLLGYFPKHRYAPPDWMRARGVEEIASVSTCIADGPEGWMESWKHNEWGFLPDPDVAWSLVPEDRRDEFRLYAYALHPIEYAENAEKPMDVVVRDVEPLSRDFELVGLDVVSRSAGSHFECSPLSCNMLLESIQTNRHCLLTDLSRAVELARTADGGGGEPGPYHVLEVWSRSDPRQAPVDRSETDVS